MVFQCACAEFPILGGSIAELLPPRLPDWLPGREEYRFRLVAQRYRELCERPFTVSGPDEGWGRLTTESALGYRQFVAEHCRTLNSLIAAHQPARNETIVDVSGGSGSYLRSLSPRFDLALHVEAHGPSLCAAYRDATTPGHRNIFFIRGSYLALPFKDHSVDAVVCTDTLIRTHEHNRLLLEGIRRILRPDGVAIVDCHARTWSTGNWDLGGDSVYTKEHFCGALMDTGFTVERIRASGYAPSTMGGSSFRVGGATMVKRLLKRPSRWVAVLRLA